MSAVSNSALVNASKCILQTKRQNTYPDLMLVSPSVPECEIWLGRHIQTICRLVSVSPGWNFSDGFVSDGVFLRLNRMRSKRSPVGKWLIQDKLTLRCPTYFVFQVFFLGTTLRMFTKGWHTKKNTFDLLVQYAKWSPRSCSSLVRMGRMEDLEADAADLDFYRLRNLLLEMGRY